MYWRCAVRRVDDNLVPVVDEMAQSWPVCVEWKGSRWRVVLSGSLGVLENTSSSVNLP